MNKSRGGSSKKTGTVVLNETIGFLTRETDPALINMRRRGWYMVCRSTVHVCNSRDIFVGYQPLSNHEIILEDTNTHVEVAGIGSVELRFTTGKVVTLSNVFHIPTGIKCLVAVYKLADIGLHTFFDADMGCTIMKNEEIVGKGYNEDGLLRLSIIEERPKLVLKETICLITVNEDPVLTNLRRRGWYLASRCSVHVCNSRDMFVDYQPLSCHEVILDNNDHVDVAGIGTVVLQFTTGKVLTLPNVFHIPAISKCLVSVDKLGESGFSICFGAEIVIENSKNHEVVGKGFVEDGMFRLSLVEDVKGAI